ncbi:MAG TPA: hypothetical protein V6D17_22700 [Candidatus Obscuribacterales bacterium]
MSHLIPGSRIIGHSVFARSLAATAFSLLVAASLSPSYAETTPSDEVMSAQQLTSLLNDGSGGTTATNLRVVGQGPNVTLLAHKEAKALDQDLKIDAIFLAKRLVDAAPAQIESVKVLFSQAGRDGRYITVRKKDLLDYGSGKIPPAKFLSSLMLIPVEQKKTLEVAEGPQFERRLLISQRIDRLRDQGTGVGPFETIFKEIEAGVKSGNDVSSKLAFLESKLSSQEEILRQAKNAQRGLGVSVPARPGTASAAGSQSGTAAQAGAPTFIPPDAEILKKTFAQQADSIIKQAQAKNSSAGQQLLTLKQTIEQMFAKKADAHGFMYMSQFQNLAAQTLGFDPLRPQQAPGGTTSQQGSETRTTTTSKTWGSGPEAGGFPGPPPGGGPPGPPGPPGGGFPPF